MQVTPRQQLCDALSQVQGGFGVISYNILLPNSAQEGWWVFKYYDPSTPWEARQWSHRHKLLRDQLLEAHTDFVCIQEATPETFAQDFAFMAEAGYDHVLHRKFRLRNATFWRADRWQLLAEGHKDRVLVTLLQSTHEPAQIVGLVNVHLTAAPSPERRFRQLFDGVDQVRKELVKLGKSPQDIGLVVCGDFNAPAQDSGTDAFLTQGSIDEHFREPRWPDKTLSSKRRAHPFGPMVDVAAQANDDPQATLIVPRHGARLCDDQGQARPWLRQALSTCFQTLAGGKARMSPTDLRAWITTINLAPERGSEWRKALKIQEESGQEGLSEEEFQSLYLHELREGKVWSVMHDLHTLGVAAQGERSLLQRRIDHIYVGTDHLQIAAFVEPLTQEQRETLARDKTGLPCAWHPSDHLPVAAAFQWVGHY